MAVTIPQADELMWPVLTALKQLGGSATVREIYETVVENEGFTEEQQAVYTRNGKMPKIQYRLHWARTRLKGIGAVTNSARGVWAITDEGMSLSPDQVRTEVKTWQSQFRGRKSVPSAGDIEENEETGESEETDEADSGELGWKEQLLELLLRVSPGGFERLAQRILREAGFTNVTVTGRSGDGGIDGLGTYRLSLVSFPVFFQCKRYRGAVGSPDIRDFRGAMVGRGEKGLFITTGTFTRDAQREASRDGATPIELIDGDQLCELLKQYRLGVTIEQRVVEDISVRTDFFTDYR
jgi:restriction system protein